MPNEYFNPTYSTDNIWREQDMERCLSDDLNAIESNIAVLETGKAASIHTHTEYAVVNHTHAGYASASDVTVLQTLVGDTAVSAQIASAVAGKADTNHTHTEYALSDHTHSGYATESYVNTQVSGLVDSAPETLNTLNELAAALGDDSNFATTIATQIGSKVAQVDGKGLSTNDYTDADKSKLDGIAAGANQTHVFKTLMEAGITTFPTTMKIIAETMPNSGVIVIDTRRINGVEANLSTQTISDWGNVTNGVAVIMKGDSEHRVSMQITYGVTSATGAYMEYGNYAYDKDKVNWGSTNDKVDKTTLSDIFGTYYNLATTVTPGANYSSANGSATLVGNMLRVQFSAERTTAASGNISNETVATFSIAHEGKITGGFSVCIGNGTSGHLANMVVANVACNETTLTFKITLTATGGDTSAVNPYFAMPVLIDVEKF